MAVCGADMAYNKIPPRWLNCPRRGQPVAGTGEGAAGGFESHSSSRAWEPRARRQPVRAPAGLGSDDGRWTGGFRIFKLVNLSLGDLETGSRSLLTLVLGTRTGAECES